MCHWEEHTLLSQIILLIITIIISNINIMQFDGGYCHVPGITGPPNSYTARGPATLTDILFTQPAVYKRHSRCIPKKSDAKKLGQLLQVPMKTRLFSAGVNL